MELYSIARDNDLFGVDYDLSVDAGHPWCLPGVECDECRNTWGAVDVEYPSVAISRTLSVRLHSGVVSVEDFHHLRDRVAHETGRTFPKLSPGTQFGPLRGRVFGTMVSDFCWASPWTIFLTRHCYDTLASHGLIFSGSVGLALRGAEAFKQEFVEVEAHPTLQIEEYSFAETSKPVCAKCGYNPKQLVEVIVKRNVIPGGCDLFRPAQF